MIFRTRIQVKARAPATLGEELLTEPLEEREETVEEEETETEAEETAIPETGEAAEGAALTPDDVDSVVDDGAPEGVVSLREGEGSVGSARAELPVRSRLSLGERTIRRDWDPESGTDRDSGLS